MKEKVSEKWFKEHGWKEYVDETRENKENARQEKVYRKHIIYSIYNNRNIVKSKKYARFDHFYEVVTDKWGAVQKRNWYMFSCYGNGFSIENRICFRKMTIEQIESALKVVGIE